MGTCIGRRNTRYFVAFLFLSGVHALLTAVIDVVFFGVMTVREIDRIIEGGTDQVSKGAKIVHLLNILWIFYSVIMFIFLMWFARIIDR